MSSDQLSKTVLNEWHRMHGARMVLFAGWEMPVQYPTGIIKEHLAVRRSAGLFDISHMSRFEIVGSDALPFLQFMLTNNVGNLEVGDAQYSFLSLPQGVLKDDAYVDRIDMDKYILITNAGNRESNWEWLKDHIRKFSNIDLIDRTDELSMMALQGPESRKILTKVLGDRKLLPEYSKNKLKVVEIDGHRVIISNTGYTGEWVCAEIITDSDFAVPLWERILDLGDSDVYLAGLGARASARIEAILPLGGHEFPGDPSGQEIPAFALDGLARIAVSFESSKGDYIGRNTLFPQRLESDQLKRGELDKPLENRILKRIIQPFEVVSGARPIAEESEIYLDCKHVGWVTSATTVPYTHFYDKGITAVPNDERGMRSIGLTYIDSDIRYSRTKPVLLTVHAKSRLKDKEKTMQMDVRVVKSFMKSIPPYSRPITEMPEIERTPKAKKVSPEEIGDVVNPYMDEMTDIAIERFNKRILLTPSIMPATPHSRFFSLLFEGDYAEYDEIIPGEGKIGFYSWVDHLLRAGEMVESQGALFFDSDFIEMRPISGTISNTAVAQGLFLYKNRFHSRQPRQGIRVITKGLTYGGHISTQLMGALNPVLGFDEESGKLAIKTFPVNPDDYYNIDIQKSLDLIDEFRPDVLILGGSGITTIDPIKEFAAGIYDIFGKNNPNRTVIWDDAAHTAGLFGKYYHNPLKEGADIVTFSAHKTIPSLEDRAGIVSSISPDSELYQLWNPYIKKRVFPGAHSSHHLGSLVASFVDLAELNAFKDEYQPQVLNGAKALALGLKEESIEVFGNPKNNYTSTHIVLADFGYAQGYRISKLAEAGFINFNGQVLPYDSRFSEASGGRFGTNPMVKRGFMTNPDLTSEDWRTVAGFIGDIYRGMDPKKVRDKVIEFRSQDRFKEWYYCLSREQARPHVQRFVEAVWGGSLYKT